MVQLNLLPDVKQEYIKTQRSKRLITSLSIIIGSAAVLILVGLLLIDFAQKKHLSDLNHDINSESATLQHEPDISQILTVQNQLESLTKLHAGKAAASRLFSGYINQLTPAAASVSDFQIDFNQHTIIISGNADSLTTVNKYVDTLKFTTYTSDNNKTATKAFSNVVLTSFAYDNSSTNSSLAASFTINLAFDPTIFDITQNVSLSVPNITTTRSALEQPTDLFQVAPAHSQPSGSGGN